jgi:endonuclease III
VSAVSAPETRTGLVRRARRIDRTLAEHYPDAHIELDFDDPFQLLVVTVLSAQTTDRRVNAVRPGLFAAYPDAAAMAAAPREHLEQIVGPLGFFRAKTDALLKPIGALFPKKDWVMLCHHLIWHGRRICHAKKPACGACPVARWCPAYGEGPVDPAVAARLVKTEGPA